MGNSISFKSVLLHLSSVNKFVMDII